MTNYGVGGVGGKFFEEGVTTGRKCVGGLTRRSIAVAFVIYEDGLVVWMAEDEIFGELAEIATGTE